MVEQISDNVGKKIVEALKMQSQAPVEQEVKIEEAASMFDNAKEEVQQEYNFDNSFSGTSEPEFVPVNTDINSFSGGYNSSLNIDSVFQNTINQNLGGINLTESQNDFEMPNNVAILNHLISKLPTGVTKQAGALIIKQTMEALGIPMKSVISEAQQVQESLTNRARECQKSIIDCKKQIAAMEIKAQQYQKQALSMNDIINLFINTVV